MLYLKGDCPFGDVPISIVDAARTVSEWMDSQGYTYWELCGICSRRYASDLKQLLKNVKALEDNFEGKMEI